LRQDEQPEEAMQIVVTDTTSIGRETARLLLSDVPDRICMRDLIRHRVREEVARYNAAPADCFTGPVQPIGSEQTLAGYLLSQPRRLDWQTQADAAVAAFLRNGFFVFVGDRQVDDLDEELALTETDVVSFVRLVPLAGG
jgi:hypothetical protein